MTLIDKVTKKPVKKGDFIFNNAGVKFKFLEVKTNGLLDVEGTDTDYHPASFSNGYQVRNS